LKILIVSSSLVIIVNGCSLFQKEVVVPAIISVGECERGVITGMNLEYVQGVWPQAQVTDVLVSGGCYQDRMIKKRQ
jgi:hypothetical protein